MKNMLSKVTGGYAASAKVVDGTLILSLPNAISPVVWRMDMGFVRASAMEIRETKDGTYMLVLKTPKEDVNEVAPFATKAKALQALMAVSNAMKHARGEIRQTPTVTTTTAESAPLANPAAHPAAYAPPKKGKWGKIMTGLFAIILLFGFLSVIISLTAPPPRNFPMNATMTDSPQSSSTTRGGNTGVGQPMSAEDFLKNR